MTRLLRTSALVPFAIALLILTGAVAMQSWAATLVVTSTADTDDGVCDGVNCTLREAIKAANASPGADVIEFSLGPGTPLIQPTSPLPVITDAVTIDGATGGATRVELNGLLATGLTDGLHVTSAGNVFKSLVISDFRGDGIELAGIGGSRVEDCFIGCDATGMTAKPNGFAAVTVTASPNNVIVNNVLSGNTTSGVVIYTASGNTIRGNLIGINASGTATLGNQDGVILINASNTMIGGPAPGDGNIIGGHSSDGVEIDGLQSTGNKVQGNYIGTNSAWANFGNMDDGVEINLAANGNTIGGNNPSESNVIANCGGNGVEVASGCTSNAILGNSISACGILGIDLAPIGFVNSNDYQDPDTGANNRQNYPVIASAAAGLGGTTIVGSLNSTPLQTFRLELFANEECSLLGAGFGKTYLGSASVTTDANGDGGFVSTVAGAPAGSIVTATATDETGNTSEFSLCRVVERVFRVRNTGTRNPAMAEASKIHQFSVWGTVNVLDGDSFTVDDGSGAPVKVLAVGHGLATGDFARAEGVLDVTGNPSVLSSATSRMERTADIVPPQIVISNPSADVTDSGPVDYLITYSGHDLITLGDADVTLIKTGTADGSATVLPDGPDTRKVRVSGTSGDGTIAIQIGPGTAKDSAGNLALAAGPSTGFAVDNTPPEITIQAPSPPTTSFGPVVYVVDYVGAASITLSTADITLNATGTATGTVGVSGSSPTARNVTISDISGTGTLSITIAPGSARDTAGNSAQGAGPSSAVTVIVGPVTVDIGAPSSANTNTGPVVFPVQYAFATAVTLSPADVTLNKTGTANGTVGVSGSGNAGRDVTISGITGNGTLSISIAAGTASGPGGSAPAAGPSAVVSVDNVAPTIGVSAPSKTLTNTGPVTFTVTYTGADVVTLSPADVTLNKTGTADATVAISGSGTTTRTVTLSPITGNGTLGIKISAGSASDLAGNPAPASASSTTFSVDNTPPVVTIGNPSKTITSAGPVTYTLSYSGHSSISLTQADIILNKTATADGTATLSGSGSVRTVTVSGTSGDGTLSISVAAGTAVDTAGNPAPAAGPSVSFTVDNTPPTISLTGPSVASTITGPVDYQVVYGGFNNITLAAANVTLNKTGTANGNITILWASASTRIVRISGITGNGTLGITIASGTATDQVALLAPGAGPSATFVVGSGNP